MRRALVLTVVAAHAQAFSIGTLISEPCHERLTARAFLDSGPLWPVESMPAAPDHLTQELSAQFAQTFAPELDAREHYALLSLLVGVRAPDCSGHTLTDLNNTRVLHSAPEDQYAHATRAASDDGADGDARVMAAVHGTIRSLLLQARTSREFITVNYEMDGYGVTKLTLWAPAYFLGRATHAVQDSFSHTLRDNGFRRVRHVMNYTDALRSTYDEARDGLRHSGSMDTCDTDTNTAVTDAAVEASRALFAARNDDIALELFAAEWLTAEPGCELSNNYCDSPWVEFAREDQTFPYLGCSSTGGLWLWGLTLLLCRRRWPGQRNRARSAGVGRRQVSCLPNQR